uniref:Uncharacterized protein n=1 Tax=Daucus carota subsp. sativus TaxID=79200 RepID=A0A175YH79_DAUCS
MDQQGHGQPPNMGVVGTSAEMPYGVAPYQANQMMGTSTPAPAGLIPSTQTPVPRGPLPIGGPAEGVPYYNYMPPQHAAQVGSPVMYMGQQPRPYMAPQMWPQQQQPPEDSDQ